tara:strand:- start:45 stop:974 length:930 start_codon:yes stop_codon:yes gene_type:complete
MIKTKLPHEIMKEAIDSGLSDFYVAYSGGKDSGVVLDIVAKNFPDYFKGVVFVNTGIGTQATIDYITDYCKKRNYRLFILKPQDVKRKIKTKRGDVGEEFSYEKLVLNYGFPQQPFHTVTMRHLKYFPLRKFIYDRLKLGEKPCIVGGIRKNESARRKLKWNKYFYNDGKMWFVSPIFFKEDSWVYDYFLKNDIKRSPVYETLHISGDCLCGCFAKKEELKLLQIFHPEVFDEIKRLEKLVKEKGTEEAQAQTTWGIHNQTTENIESQSQLESFVCNECFFDRDGKEIDTKRFNDEMAEIDKKLGELDD